MPHRQQSIKVIIAKSLMFVGMFVIVGHSAADFWASFVLQTELINMKTSLHSLKNAVNNIETAYDNLYEELQDLAPEDKASYKPETSKRTKKRLNTLNKEDDDTQAQAVMQARILLDMGTTFDKAVEDFMQQCKVQPSKNTSTLTYPLSGVEQNCTVRPKRLTPCLHRCYNCSIADEIVYSTLY